MTPKERLKSIVSEQYVSEDGEEYMVELMNGLSEEEMNDFINRLPNRYLPDEIRELLHYARGFKFFGLDDITFDCLESGGFRELLPCSVELAGDGFGNFWVVDIDQQGNWNNVWYICHDPSVIIKHSENVSQFIEHVHEFGKKGELSNLDDIHERVVMNIWNGDNDFIERKEALKSDDKILKDFALSLPSNYVIIDLRNKPCKSGFAWGKFSENPSNIHRHETELMWGMYNSKNK